MKMRKSEQMAKSLRNQNENWMFDKLNTTGFKWSRNCIWGFRLFDFWCNQLGIAIEVDGPEHNAEYDDYRDRYNFQRSGIVVLRVRNKNESDAFKALRFISISETWLTRRELLGIPTKSKSTFFHGSSQHGIIAGELGPESATVAKDSACQSRMHKKPGITV